MRYTSGAPPISMHGSWLSRTPRTHLQITFVRWSLVTYPLPPQMRKRVVGFVDSLMLYDWRCWAVRGTCAFLPINGFSLSRTFSAAKHASNLIRSLPHLQNLCFRGDLIHDNGNDAIFQPSTPLPLVETLRLSLKSGTKEDVYRLLNIQNVIRPRRLRCTWYHEEDVQWIAVLVKKYSNTLEHVDFRDARYRSSGTSCPFSLF